MTERTIMGHLTVDNYPMEGNRWIVPTTDLNYEAVIIGLDGPSTYPITGYLRKTSDKTLSQTCVWSNRGIGPTASMPNLCPPEKKVITHRAWIVFQKDSRHNYSIVRDQHSLKTYNTDYTIIELVGHETLPLK